VQRKIAHAIKVPNFGEPVDESDGADDGVGRPAAAVVTADAEPSSSAAAAAARAACHRGHRLPATAVALASDDSFAVSVSKDGSILKWDLTTMAKTRLFRPGAHVAGMSLNLVA